MVRVIDWLGTGKTGWTFFGVCALAGLLMVGAALLPYSPLKVHSIFIVPDEVCPSAGVEAVIDRTWDRTGAVYGVDDVTITSYWENAETGARYPSVSAVVSPRVPPYGGEVRSPVVELAPPDPGPYELFSGYEVEGRTLFFGATQTVSPTPSRNMLTVNECPGEG